MSACGDNARPELVDEPPVLGHDAMWVFEGDVCFGFSGTASGDLDGDGLDELIMVSPDCSWFGVPDALVPQVSVFRGTPGGFEDTPVVYVIEDPEPFALFRPSVGDVNGDGRHDLMIRGRSSAALFLGVATLEDLFETRHDGISRPGTFFDADGDGDDEFLGALGVVGVFDWIGGGLAEIAAIPGHRLARAGDADGDGIGDLYVETALGVDLYYGCAAGACTDGLPNGPVAVPVSTLPDALGDVDGDGRGDAIVRDAWRTLSLHLADDSGVLKAEPEWTVYPDYLHGLFGEVRALGDVNGDGFGGDLGVSMAGRTMVFFADDGGPAGAPGWAWRFQHATSAGFAEATFRPVFHRDFDGDGYTDVVIHEMDAEFVGRLLVLRGGERPADATAPSLPTEFACASHEGTLPDLTVDRDLIARSLRIRTLEFAPDSCEVLEQCVTAPGDRKLLDFSVAVQNFGGGAAIIPGPSIDPTLYEYDECHHHHHLVDFADYVLLDGDGQAVVAGHKQGYFLIDVAAYCDVAPEPTPGFDYLFLSPGWADIYFAGLECQWVDITDVPDGTYRLQVRVNASGVFVEDDELPNVVEVPIEIAGDRVTASAARTAGRDTTKQEE